MSGVRRPAALPLCPRAAGDSRGRPGLEGGLGGVPGLAIPAPRAYDLSRKDSPVSAGRKLMARTVSCIRFLEGLTLSVAALRIGLPPLAAMFDAHGTAYADGAPPQSRFILWFNGNGIPERYWIPSATGPDY